MKLDELNRLLEEGKVEEATNDILKDLNKKEDAEEVLPEMDNETLYNDETEVAGEDIDTEEIVNEEVSNDDEEVDEIKPEMDNETLYNDETEVAAEDIATEEIVNEELGDNAVEVVHDDEEAEEVLPEMDNETLYNDETEVAAEDIATEEIVNEGISDLFKRKKNDTTTTQDQKIDDENKADELETQKAANKHERDTAKENRDHELKTQKAVNKHYEKSKETVAQARKNSTDSLKKQKAYERSIDRVNNDHELKTEKAKDEYEREKRNRGIAKKNIVPHKELRAAGLEARGEVEGTGFKSMVERNKAARIARRDLKFKVAKNHNLHYGFQDLKEEIEMWLLENNYEVNNSNLVLILEALAEDTLEVNPVEVDAIEAGYENGVIPVSVNRDLPENEDDEAQVDLTSTVSEIEADINDPITESINNIFAILNSLNEEVDEIKPELDNETLYNEETEVAAQDIDTEEIVNEELGDNAVEVAHDDEEAEEIKPEMDNETLYNDETEVAGEDIDTEKISVSEAANKIFDIIVEATKNCKKETGRALKEDVLKIALPLIEEEVFDIDASIESSEMNGNEEKFEKYEDIQGDGANAALTAECKKEDIKESIAYTSLKEACLLEANYFAEDSYIRETAESKLDKLTEEVAIVMARENNDPLYEELVRSAAYTERLYEACTKKYGKVASARAKAIARQ